MGAFAPERGFDPAYLQRRGVRGPGGSGLAPRTAGRRLRGLRIDPAPVRGRGGLALLADRRPRPGGVRARSSERAGPGSRVRRGRTCWLRSGTTLGSTAGSVLVHDGQPGAFAIAHGHAPEFSFGRAGDVAASHHLLGSVQHGGDALVRLNDAFTPDPVFVDVPAGVTVERPLLVVHWCGPGAAAFPRTVVRAGEGASVSVVEVFAGAEGAARSLVVPVTELAAAGGASLSYVSLQILGRCRLVDRAGWRRAGRAGPPCARSPSVWAPPTAGSAPTSRWTDGTPPAKSSRPISATGPRCTTSGPCRTTRRRGRPASCCARVQWPGGRARSTAD